MSETATAKAPLGKGEGFINYLKKLADNKDRAALSALRRSLGKSPGEAAEAHPYVLWCSPNENHEKWFYLVAGLFALHPKSWTAEEGTKRGPNFGASFAAMKRHNEQERRVEDKGSERRFVALLDCHEDDLPQHLRHAVSLLRSKEIPIDWSQLLNDLCFWGDEKRRVQLRWARAFWGDNQPDDDKTDDKTIAE